MPVKFVRQTYAMFSSKIFLFWIIGGWIIYYVTSAIWMDEAFGTFMSHLRENPLIQVPFVLFLVSGYLNLLRSSTARVKKSKIQFIIWFILPFGTLLFFTGYFISGTMRDSGQRIVGEGDIIDPPWSKEKYQIIRFDPGLKNYNTDGDSVAEVFAYEPKLSVLNTFSQNFEIGSFPPAKLKKTYFHILNFGIAPGVRLFDRGRIINEGYMVLRIISPGSTDQFEISPYPYKYIVTLRPEKTMLQSTVPAPRFDLKNLRFYVRVFQGDKVIAEGDPADGIKIKNLTLFFFEPTFWALLEAVKDPGVSVMHFGVILITFGIPLTFIRTAIVILKYTNVLSNSQV